MHMYIETWVVNTVRIVEELCANCIVLQIPASNIRLPGAAHIKTLPRPNSVKLLNFSPFFIILRKYITISLDFSA